MNLINKLRSLSRLILPPAEIGGLQVSNTSIRFMVLKRGSNGDLSAKSASLRLPPGIIDEGRVKDKPNFVEALRSLHAQITPKGNETINVILTVPAGEARHLLDEVLPADAHYAAVAAEDDPDLTTT